MSPNSHFCFYSATRLINTSEPLLTRPIGTRAGITVTMDDTSPITMITDMGFLMSVNQKVQILMNMMRFTHDTMARTQLPKRLKLRAVGTNIIEQNSLYLSYIASNVKKIYPDLITLT